MIPARSLLLAMAAFGPPALWQELLPDRPIEIELDSAEPVLAGHGPARALAYDVTFEGTLYAWAASQDLDPLLRVVDADGRILAQDDDSGGGTTACVELAAPYNELISIQVAADEAGRAGSVVVCVVEAPETETTRAEAARALAEMAEVQRLRGTDLAEARSRAEALIERIAGVPGAERSEALESAAAVAGELAHELLLPRSVERARRLVLAQRSRTLPGDHPHLQWARANLALAIKAFGDLEGARALEEQVLEVFSRTLPADDSDLQPIRQNLANTLRDLGDLAAARRLEEQVLAALSASLPDDAPELQKARANLAITIMALGDLAGARALQEQVLEVRSRTLEEDDFELQTARGNLSLTLKNQGELAAARDLEELVLASFTRTLPRDDSNLQVARSNLAKTLSMLGDLPRARELAEQAVAGWSETLPDEHPNLQTARQNLAAVIKDQGDLAAARELDEKVLAVRSATLPDDHPDLQAARNNLAWTIARQLAQGAAPGAHGPQEGAAGRQRCLELVAAHCRGSTAAARAALLGSPREAEARCHWIADDLGLSLSFAEGLGIMEPAGELERAAFVLSETTRGAALGSASLMRRAAGAPRYGELWGALQASSQELAALVQRGATSRDFQQALARREELEQDLVDLARELSGGPVTALDFDPEALAGRLAEGAAAVAYRRYRRWSFRGTWDEQVPADRSAVETAADSLCAFVVHRPDAAPADAGGTPTEPRIHLARVELGTIAAVERAVDEWRAALGAAEGRGVGTVASAGESELRARGESLRRLVFDPLLPELQGADHLVLTLDDVLHLVPFDALPAQAGGDALLGERWSIEVRCTLAELARESAPPASAGALVAIGGVAFDSAPIGLGAEQGAEEFAPGEAAATGAPPGEAVAAVLRGGAWERGFAPLPFTAREAREIGALHARVFGEREESLVLEQRRASRAALEELAPRARWLHVATHGWFAAESVRSWSDAEPLDELSGLGRRAPGIDQVRGMSPMLLCGLALAGAGLPQGQSGRGSGLITAEELAALDLSRCELAVLSACDTNVGERRAGQGVASLQRALQMAGARTVITSLWKVPDEATQELMLEFYRRLWVERLPKRQALWEAKLWLRAARGERGQARYGTSDWAGWVLTGDPR